MLNSQNNTKSFYAVLYLINAMKILNNDVAF